MRIALLCLGDELLKGAVVNTNLAYMGQRLLELGIMPELCVEVPDEPHAAADALQYALAHADFIITSGGLGPTADDLTKQAVADCFKLPLEFNEAAARAVRGRWAALKQGKLPARFLNQACIPRGAAPLLNSCGSAPGIHLRTPDGKQLVMLPGPPAELQPMFEHQLLPLLIHGLDSRLHTRLFFVSGVPESRVEERMQPVIAAHPGLSVAYCAQPEMVKLFLTSADPDCVAHAEQSVRAEFARELLRDGNRSVAEDVIALLKERGAVLALAESCTGGLIAKLLTDVPGASAAFSGGVVAYANTAKHELLNVPEEILQHYGAVSSECAKAMLRGAAARFHSDCAVAVTGIAGPGGGTSEKPVGLVFIGVKCFGRVSVTEHHFRDSRAQVRDRTAAVALNTLRLMLRGDPLP